jgi:hypothetical protein
MNFNKDNYIELLEETVKVNKELNKNLKKRLVVIEILTFIRDNLNKYSKEKLLEKINDCIEFLSN